YDRRIDGLIAQSLMSIPSVKAVEIGSAIKGISLPGSKFMDEIFYRSGRYLRTTNRAGGIEGGMTNGENIVCRVYHKPLATPARPLRSVNIKTHKQTRAVVERSDTCAVPRAGVISESMLSFVLARCMLEKFGGDTTSEIKNNYQLFMGVIK
ncbi:MAG TPA: chorismate synthase, partial [bacterium]|nr:chorismate synthase [bacterium]